jgi:hypothetical protein
MSSGYASRNFDIREFSSLHLSPAFIGFHKHSVTLFTGNIIHKKEQLCESVCNTKGGEKNVSLWCHTTVLSVGCFPNVGNEALGSWSWVSWTLSSCVKKEMADGQIGDERDMQPWSNNISYKDKTTELIILSSGSLQNNIFPQVLCFWTLFTVLFIFQNTAFPSSGKTYSVGPNR